MNTFEADPAAKKEKKVGYSIAGSLSLFLHVGLFLLIGGTVIVESIIPKQTMIGDVQVNESLVDSPVEETPEDVPEDNVPQPTDITQPQAAASVEASPFDMNTITVDSPAATFSIPPLGSISAQPGVATGTVGAGGSGSTGMAGAKKPINLFGAKVDAAKLGVILDVSGSAHSFLLAAMREVDKNFDNAPTVLAMGCGLGEPTENVEVKVFGKMTYDKVKDGPRSFTVLEQIHNAEEKKGLEELKKYLDRMRRRNDVFGIYGGRTAATGYGFETLIKEGVDTIYWFADFRDRVDPKVAAEITKELKRKGIKVIAHNFAPPSAKESGRPGWSEATKMASETGGTTIVKIPD